MDHAHDESSLDAHDHRKLGRRLDLFHQQDDGPGMVFWHPRGLVLYRLVEDAIRRRMAAAGFAEIRTPQVLARRLWRQSGHWDKYGPNMFSFSAKEAPAGDGDGDAKAVSDARVYALKPMSCPGHVQIFNAALHSFRDLPVRYAEFGLCHRNEPSGALSGLMRLRAFTQDDAHIFCRDDQVVEEVAKFCALLISTYRAFGFTRVDVGLSLRPAVRAGDDAVWDKAEAALATAARAAGMAYREQPGEGAFYGPKLDFTLTDKRGRAWQCGTIQLDMVLPERLDANYVEACGARRRPVMLHHAVLGSLERFIAILLEHHEGRLPLWLAPDQVVIASVTDAQAEHARACLDAFRAAGLRATLDVRAERIARKSAEARDKAIPAFCAVGAREAHDETVSLRLGEGPAQVMEIAAACAALRGAAPC